MEGTTKRNLQIGFGLSLLILLASSIASYISIRNLIYSANEVSKTNLILHELNSVLSNAKDAETGVQALTDKHITLIEKHLAAKEKEIMAV